MAAMASCLGLPYLRSYGMGKIYTKVLSRLLVMSYCRYNLIRDGSLRSLPRDAEFNAVFLVHTGCRKATPGNPVPPFINLHIGRI